MRNESNAAAAARFDASEQKFRAKAEEHAAAGNWEMADRMQGEAAKMRRLSSEFARAARHSV